MEMRIVRRVIAGLIFSGFVLSGCAGVPPKYLYKDPAALVTPSMHSEITWCKRKLYMKMESITLHKCKSGLVDCLYDDGREEIYTTGWPPRGVWYADGCKVLLSPGEYYIEYAVYLSKKGFISAYGPIALQPTHTYQIKGKKVWRVGFAATWIVDVSTGKIVLGSDEPERAIRSWAFDDDYYQVPDRTGN